MLKKQAIYSAQQFHSSLHSLARLHLQSFTPLKPVNGIQWNFQGFLSKWHYAPHSLFFFIWMIFWVSYIKQWPFSISVIWDDELSSTPLKPVNGFHENFRDLLVKNVIVHLLINFCSEWILGFPISSNGLSVIYLVAEGMHPRALQKLVKW